jgi:hypothetical protein
MASTQITVVGDDRYRAEGTAKEVAQLIVDASRGSLVELAWFTETSSGRPLAINPEHVVGLWAGAEED